MNHQVFRGVGTKLTCTHPLVIVMAHIFSFNVCTKIKKQEMDEWMNEWIVGWMNEGMDGHCGMALHPLKLMAKVQTNNNFKLEMGLGFRV
jgi:hypothetical protein